VLATKSLASQITLVIAEGNSTGSQGQTIGAQVSLKHAKTGQVTKKDRQFTMKLRVHKSTGLQSSLRRDTNERTGNDTAYAQ
jgi:hypothetical protein